MTEQGYNWGYPVSCAADQSTVTNSGSDKPLTQEMIYEEPITI